MKRGRKAKPQGLNLVEGGKDARSRAGQVVRGRVRSQGRMQPYLMPGDLGEAGQRF